MFKKVVLFVAALTLLIGFGASPASAAAWSGESCKTVMNTDGTPAGAVCAYHVHAPNWDFPGPPAMADYANLKVWNCPLPTCHSDSFTNVTWHYVNEAGTGGVVNYGNVADGDTDDYADVRARQANNVWAEIHDSYAPFCNRVFFNHTSDVPTVTTC